MILFEVNGKEYSLPDSLSEVTLDRFIDFQEKVYGKKPETLEEAENLNDPEERKAFISTLSTEEIEGAWFNYYVLYVMYFTELEEDVAGKISKEGILELYNLIYKLLRVDFVEMESFEHKGDTYYLPKAPENYIAKTKLYMQGSTSIEFITAMQYDKYAQKFGNSDWAVYPYIIATICRKKDEQLPLDVNEREQFLESRAKLFKDLTLDKAFNVAFFLLNRKAQLKEYSSLYSLIRLLRQLAQERKRLVSGTDG